MCWGVAGENVLPAEVETVVPPGFCPGAVGTGVLLDALCETGVEVNGALNGIEALRNANRLLPQHMVVSFRWLRTRLNDDGFHAQPFEQARPARDRQP